MKTSEIRSRFLKFFESKKHKVIYSDSLVPKNDPTVLFTTAGMQQFKRQFLGYIEGFTRATTSQKCLRTDDLDEVGKTDFHHTFFEMLGNFSFGDYFKKDAISWAWEFLTKEMKISPDKLWVSVYKDDEEAYKIWADEIKVPKNRIVKLGDKSNFWPSNAKQNGPNGPCGPCSEIFFDYGVNSKCASKVCDPDCSCGRFSEIWNLVFTQFDRKDGGVLEALPSKNIDTGMGLERLASVLQGVKSNFDTDIFLPIMKAIEKEVDANNKLAVRQKRIIADHIRAVTFGLNDGIVPSNEGRGYVMKKLIVNASDIAIQKGIEKPVIYKLVKAVVEAMKDAYPEIEKSANHISDSIKAIEEAYIKVYRERIPELRKKLKADKTPEEIGRDLFLYSDTYGVTLPSATAILFSVHSDNKKLCDDGVKEHQNLLRLQQDRSRASSKMTGDVFANRSLDLNVPKTEFVGNRQPSITATILRLFVNDEVKSRTKKGDQVKIILDKSPFYAESGGQVGDTGFIVKDKNKIQVNDTQKQGEVFIHIGVVTEGEFNTNDQVSAEIDFERRLAIMRNHTATHLLQAVLREILGPHIKQQGSWVGEERLRFDFTNPKAITKEQLQQVEAKVNEYILMGDSITKEYLSVEEAKETGALAFFAEKYGETVRVVSIGEYSKEFCGGTHLENAGQIGLFKILRASAIAQGIRRIEANTGIGAYNYVSELQKQLEETAGIIKSPVNEVAERVKTQADKIKDLEKELAVLRFEAIKGLIDNIIDKAEVLNNSKIITHKFDNIEMEILRKVSDLIRQKEKSAVIIIAAKMSDNVSILISASDDLIQKGIKANELVAKVAGIINGSGGGRPQLAQAGGKDLTKIDEAITKATLLVKESLIK